MDGRDNEEHIMYNMIDEGTGGYHYDGADDDGDDDGSQYLNLDEADRRDDYDEFFGGDDGGTDGGDTIAKTGEVYKASADHELVDALVDSYIYIYVLTTVSSLRPPHRANLLQGNEARPKSWPMVCVSPLI